MAVMVNYSSGYDGYLDNKDRQVILRHGRYRVTRGKLTGVYSIWYGGSLIRMGNRADVVEQFKTRVSEMRGIRF